MKIKIFALLIITLFSYYEVNAQDSLKKNDPVGQWKFEAPMAPEGYTSGIITVSQTEKKFNTTMAFTGSEYIFTGNEVKVVKDSVYFSINIESESVKVRLKLEDIAKMTGQAAYSEGIVPLTLTRDFGRN